MAHVWGVFGGVLRGAGHIRLVAKQLPTLPAVCPSQIAGRGIKLTHRHTSRLTSPLLSVDLPSFCAIWSQVPLSWKL